MEKDRQRYEEGDQRQSMSYEGQIKKVHGSLKRGENGLNVAFLKSNQTHLSLSTALKTLVAQI